jgi:hypothetical protein
LEIEEKREREKCLRNSLIVCPENVKTLEINAFYE